MAIIFLKAFEKILIVFPIIICVSILFPLDVSPPIPYLFQHAGELAVLMIFFIYSSKADKCRYASVTPFLTCIEATYFLKFLDTLTEYPETLEYTMGSRRHREIILSAVNNISRADETAGKKILKLLNTMGIKLETRMEVQRKERSILTNILLVGLIIVIGAIVLEILYYTLFSRPPTILRYAVFGLRELASTMMFVGIFAFVVSAISDYMFRSIFSIKREKLNIALLANESFRQSVSLLLGYLIKFIAYHLDKPLAIALRHDYEGTKPIKVLYRRIRGAQMICPLRKKPELPDISFQCRN